MRKFLKFLRSIPKYFRFKTVTEKKVTDFNKCLRDQKIEKVEMKWIAISFNRSKKRIS